MKKSILLTIAITTMMILWFTNARCQISIAAGAGIAYKQSPALAGQLSVSYQLKNLEGSFNMLSLPFKAPTYFGITGGYILSSNDWQIKPYAGINYKFTGNTHSEDTYVHNGTVTTLSTGKEVNKVVGSFGMMIIKGVGFVDASYLDNTFGVTVGLRYSFNR